MKRLFLRLSSMRPRAQTAAIAWPAAALAGFSFGLALLSGLSFAHAASPEPILFLGIQRGNNIDRVGTDLVREYLVDRGELVQKTVQLSDVDRRCRRQQCLSELAESKQAVLVLSGDVSPTGPTRNLRVQLRLFDQRRRGTPDALAEIENLCIDCDETKLGIMLTGSTSELLSQYRQFAGSTGPTPPSPPAAVQAPVAPADTSPAAPKAEPSWPAWQPRPSSPSAGVVPSGGERPVQPAAPQPAPGYAPQPAPGYAPQPAPGYASSSPTQTDPMAQPAAPAAPLAGAAGYAPQVAYPAQQSQWPATAVGAQQAPAPVYVQQPVPVASRAPAAPAKKPLSALRKGVAAVFGVLGFGSLITAAVMHGLDRRLAPDLSVNPMGTACMMPENAGRSCVLSTVAVYAPTYAVGGLMVAGMILTLTIPESKPRPLSEPLIP